MIRKPEEFTKDLREQMRGGSGTIEIDHFVTSAELNDKGRLFAKITVNPGCSIGYHVHEADSEIFYVIKGTAEYDDNGTATTITEGDIVICAVGEGHSVTNNTEEAVELIALVLHA